METSPPPDWHQQLAALQQQIAEQQRTLQKLESQLAQPPSLPSSPPPQMRFCDWLKIGFAVTLPLLTLGAVLLLILLVWSLKYKPLVSPP